MNQAFLPLNIQPQARYERLLTQEVKDEILVYDLNTHQTFCLNSTAAAVWLQCDGNQNIDQIIKTLKQEKQLETNQELIRLTLYELDKNNLLIQTEELSYANNGFNRRDAIRRLAVGTAFALPIISFLVAPTAADAQGSSCLQPLCTTNTLNQPCCFNNDATLIGFCVNLGGPVGQIVPVCELICTQPTCSPTTLLQPCCGVPGNPQALGFCVNLGGPVNQVVPVCTPISNR